MVPIVREHIAEICTKDVRAYEEYLFFLLSILLWMDYSFMCIIFLP